MSVSAEGAEKYFDEALKKSDYYAKDLGVWGGKGADRLGLKGEEFLALASNKVPGTEENLAVRTKEQADGRLRFLLFGSEVGFGLPCAKR